jgi:hypothetical protein
MREEEHKDEEEDKDEVQMILIEEHESLNIN